jgi:hypothetical protein
MILRVDMCKWTKLTGSICISYRVVLARHDCMKLKFRTRHHMLRGWECE